MNKKGSVFDMMLGITILFAGGIAMLIAATFWVQMYNDNLLDQIPAGRSFLDNFNSFTFWTFDFILIMAFIGFFVGAVILAAFARHHPILAWVNVLVLIVLIMISMPLSNAYQDIVLESSLTGAGDIPIFNLVMANLPFLVIIFGAFLLLAMFAFKSEVRAL